MSGITPKFAELHQFTTEYLEDGRSIIEGSLAVVETSSAFAEVYHISLSVDTVLGGLKSGKLRPRLAGARSIVLRLPLLIGIGQQSVAMVDLRRFIELICWAVYFSDHPIEWLSFQRHTEAGFSQEMRRPISHAAHRELSYYIEYAHELMASEPSGLGLRAVESIKQVSHKLNADVHARQMAQATGRRPPHDDVSDAALRKFARFQRLTFSSCCILFSAYRARQFDRFNAPTRAHFDWLVGATIRRKVREGPFGLLYRDLPS